MRSIVFQPHRPAGLLTTGLRLHAVLRLLGRSQGIEGTAGDAHGPADANGRQQAAADVALDGLGGQAELNRGFAQGQERGVSGGGLSRRFGC